MLAAEAVVGTIDIVVKELLLALSSTAIIIIIRGGNKVPKSVYQVLP